MTVSRTDEQEEAAASHRAHRLLSGVDTVCELLVARRSLDERDGLDTATFVSGYPGSPLGGMDLALDRLGDRLAANRIVHRPGLNEELAAAAVWGSQMGGAVPYDGGRRRRRRLVRQGPRAGPLGRRVEARQPDGHGSRRRRRAVRRRRSVGQVVDPAVRHQPGPGRRLDAGARPCRPAGPLRLRRRGVPPEPLLRLLGRDAHRDCGRRRHRHRRHRHRPLPRGRSGSRVDGRPWTHEPTGQILRSDLEELWLDRRLRAAQGWVAARGLDRVVGVAGRARLGIVCAGKTYRDVLGALEACGLGLDELERAGIRILKLAMTFPVAPHACWRCATPSTRSS